MNTDISVFRKDAALQVSISSLSSNTITCFHCSCHYELTSPGYRINREVILTRPLFYEYNSLLYSIYVEERAEDRKERKKN